MSIKPLTVEEYKQFKKNWTNVKTRWRTDTTMPNLFAMVDRLLATPETPKPKKTTKPAEKPEALTQEDLEEMTVKELKALAEKDGVEVPKGARKAEIIDALMSA